VQRTAIADGEAFSGELSESDTVALGEVVMPWEDNHQFIGG